MLFWERMIPIYSHCTGPFKRCVAPWKQRSNFGHARGSILAGRALIFVKNFTGKHRKQSLSRKISESKLKRSQKSVKGTENRGRKTVDCSNTKFIEVQFYQKCLTFLKLRKEDISSVFRGMYVCRNLFSQLWNWKFQVLLIPAKFEGLPFCQVTFFLLLLFMFFFLFEVQSPSSLPTLWSRRVRDMFSTQSRCWGIREESRASVRCLSWILLHQQVCKLWKQKARSFPYCILPWENLIHIT